MNKSETCQDLFALLAHQIIKPNSAGFWVDFGARNWGNGFGQNNTVLLYEKGWSGLSMDIGDFGKTYDDLDKSRVFFEKIDCTNVSEVKKLFTQHNVPKTIDYLNFDIDEATEGGLQTLASLIEDGYIFNIITIEHDSYRVGTRVRNLQRDLLSKCLYVRVGELDKYEDWWIHSSVHTKDFEKLAELSSIEHRGRFTADDLLKVKNLVMSLTTPVQ